MGRGSAEVAPEGRYQYSAFFEEGWAAARARAAAIRAWLLDQGCFGILEEGGDPIQGMHATVRVAQLTGAQVLQFRERFAPAREVLIPVLAVSDDG